jgi:hypothetical protein
VAEDGPEREDAEEEGDDGSDAIAVEVAEMQRLWEGVFAGW